MSEQGTCRQCGQAITQPPYSNSAGRNQQRRFCTVACYRAHQSAMGIGHGGPRTTKANSTSKIAVLPCSECSTLTTVHGKRLGAVRRGHVVQCSEECRSAHVQTYRVANQRKHYERRGKPNARRNVALRRARQQGSAVVERVDIRAIAERDQCVCHICKRRVDMSRTRPDPLSPSIDHLVPIADGGDHSHANIMLAHLVCNMRRGARRGNAVQLRLVG